MLKLNKISRMALVAAVAMCSALTALAGNTLTLGDGSPIAIKPGESKVITVNLKNDSEVSSMQFDMELTSDQIEIVEGSLKVNEDRVPRELFTSTLYHMADGKWRYSILTKPTALNVISGNDGALGTFTIKAKDTFTKDCNAKIEFSTCVGSDTQANKVAIDVVSYLNVTPQIGSFTLGETSFSIKPGGKHTVDVMLDNEIDLVGLQSDIYLPEGLHVAKNSKGNLDFAYSDRLPTDFSISSAQRDGFVRVVISSLPVVKFTGNSGKLFSFTVEADENFVSNEDSKITFKKTIGSDANGSIYNIETGEAVATVTSAKIANDAAYTKLSEEIAALQKKLDEAKAKVAEECKDVAAEFDATAANIQQLITALKEELDGKNAACDLTEESALDAQKVADINAAIEKYVSDAQEAQAYKVKKDANDAAYARLKEDIAALQKSLDDAKAQVAEECKDVAGNYTATTDAIQQLIVDLMNDLEKDNADVALTAESTLDENEVKAINDAIAAYIAAAKEAQAKVDADRKAYEDKVAANEAAYKRLSEELAAVQARFDEVKSIIRTDYATVASQFSATELTIQSELKSVAKDLKASYDKIELDENSQLDIDFLKEAIEQLLEDAKKAYETTGINGAWMSLDGAECTGIYTLSGTKVETPAKGMPYIIRYANGKTVKVVVK